MENKFNLGDMVKIVRCGADTDKDIYNIFDKIGEVVSPLNNNGEHLIYFKDLESRFDCGRWYLHNDTGRYKEHKYLWVHNINLQKASSYCNNTSETMLISKDKAILVKFVEETANDTFKGVVIVNNDPNSQYAKVGDEIKDWLKNEFEIATKENTPEEWWEHLSNNDKFVENVEEIAERYDIQVIKKENETPKKYRVVKLNPTENQERQYGVMLLKNLTEIIEGQTMAFINSKGSGGVIYGRKANGLLNKLVISNPNKHITVVKTLKAHGKKQEAIKQISIKIENRIEPSEFVL